MTGKADYYARGQWNFYCDLCGAKTKSSDGVRTWNNLWVCSHHKEVRNPQDFVRGIKDDQTTPWRRSRTPDQFVSVCTLRGTNAIPGYAVPGCSIPGFINLTFIQEAIPEGEWVRQTAPLAIPDMMIPDYAFPDNINHGGNDLNFVFDSMPTKAYVVADNRPGHEGETFVRVAP